MKIVKYFMIAIILVGLYITYPIWKLTPVKTDVDIVEINQNDQGQQHEINQKLAADIELENKFGKKPYVAYKSRVPAPVQAYWDKTLKNGESIYEDICSPLQAGSKGWTTNCQYKIKKENGSSELMFNTYVIKDGQLIH